MNAYGFVLEELNSFETIYKLSRIKMTPQEQQISFLNKYFIYKKVRNVNTTEIHRQYLQGEIQEFSIGKPISLNKKIVLKK